MADDAAHRDKDPASGEDLVADPEAAASETAGNIVAPTLPDAEPVSEDDAAPDDAAPDDAAPDDAAPDDAAPGDAAPDDAAPDDTAPDDAAPDDGDGSPLEPDIHGEIQAPREVRESPYARTEPFVRERGLYAPPRPTPPWSPLRRASLFGLGLLAPCAVIALSLYFIVKGGAPHAELAPAGAPALPPVAAGVPPLGEEPDEDASAASAEPTASGNSGLEAPMVAVPGFEDEGSDEEPPPTKPAVPKHFNTVQEAALGSCSTESVDGLSRQIIEQARCIKPNDFVALPKRPNLIMAPHVYPYLELAARDHLLKALDSHTSQTMTINSALRTVAQQYLVSHWAGTKICGVQLATRPGESNHEIGSALDIAEASKWRPALEAQQFRWLGASDRVHFDYKGDNSGPRTATDVLAFQKLWNRNHAEDPIPENGQYGAPTEQRLKKSPPNGFPLGASCRPSPRKP